MGPILCGNFDFETHQFDLECLFSKYVKLDHVDMKSDFAFVYFEDDRDAEDAIRGLNNAPFGYDRHRLTLEWAKFETQEDATEALKCTHMSKISDRVVSVEYALMDDDEKGDRYDSPRRDYGRHGDSPYRRSPGPTYRRGGASRYLRSPVRRPRT